MGKEAVTKVGHSSLPVQAALPTGSHTAWRNSSHLPSFSENWRSTHSLHRILCFTPTCTVFLTMPPFIPQCPISSDLWAPQPAHTFMCSLLCVHLPLMRVSSSRKAQLCVFLSRTSQGGLQHSMLPGPPIPIVATRALQNLSDTSSTLGVAFHVKSPFHPNTSKKYARTCQQQ